VRLPAVRELISIDAVFGHHATDDRLERDRAFQFVPDERWPLSPYRSPESVPMVVATRDAA
jgi:hypothetical protein